MCLTLHVPHIPVKTVTCIIPRCIKSDFLPNIYISISVTCIQI